MSMSARIRRSRSTCSGPYSAWVALVRSLAVAGWAPSFDACARCGALHEVDSELAVRPAAPMVVELAVAA